ncbi:MAG TPA: DUF4097 family beta strand repeat-containing protein [Gemmatimonas sp.]|uniref:DUF4097 family beta strand repeat-containing protein n=1 Tax=Gemmatimonas sp. TaxID=1962908 RepID=UPI002ED98E1A
MKTPQSLSMVTGLAVALSLGVTMPTQLEAQRGGQRGGRDTTLQLTGTSVVDVTLSSGHLVVRSVDGTTGAVRGLRNDQRLRSTGVALTVVGRDEQRRSFSGSSSSRNRSDDVLEVDVPRGVRLVVNTRSGDVDVQEFAGDVEITTQSGTLQLAGVRGRVIAESVSGDITITGAPSSVRITTVSGDIGIRGARGDVEIHTTSGDVRIDGEQIPRLLVESMNADVDFDGSLTDDARVQLSTHSGDVTLRLPESQRGRIELSTVSGDFSSGMPLIMAPNNIPSSNRGRATRRYELGSGGKTQIDISTFSGDVRILRGNRS